MESEQFEKLEEKVEMALKVISDLRQLKITLNDELDYAKERISELELKNEELEKTKSDIENSLTEKSSSMANAGEKIQNLIAKLEAENLEQVV